MSRKVSNEEFIAIRQDDEQKREEGQPVDPNIRKLLDHILALENDIAMLESFNDTLFKFAKEIAGR